MSAPLSVGDRVYSDDSNRFVGTVLKTGVGISKDMVSVQLDPNSSFPAGMSLKVGGFERSWIRVGELPPE